MTDMPQHDLYKVIELASKKRAADQDRLTQAEVDAIAKELGIDPAYVDEAQEELQRIRAQEARDQARRARLFKFAIIGIAAVLLIAACLGISARSTLMNQLTEVDKSKAQLSNVMERQDAVRKRLANAKASRSKDAELAGAENRVRIQRKRYDEGASEYNRMANGLLNGIWCTVFRLPSAVPLSNDVNFSASGVAQ